MKKLVVIALLALVAWWVFFAHGSSKFGCDATGLFGPGIAYADSADCPADVHQAAQDSQWAADRVASIQDDPITAGLLYTEDGSETKLTSGESGDEYDSALGYLAGELGAKQAAGHVEVKAAAKVRDDGSTFAVLVINNPVGMCTYTLGVGCKVVASMILPKDSTMVVWWPSGGPVTVTGSAS